MNSNKNEEKKYITLVIQSCKKAQNTIKLVNKILVLEKFFFIDIILIGPESNLENYQIIRNLSIQDRKIKLINKKERFLFSGEIKEKILDSKAEIIAFIDGNQHEPTQLKNALDKLFNENLDLVLGSRYHENSKIKSSKEEKNFSTKLINKIFRYKLSKKYLHITDYFTNFFVLKKNILIRYISNNKLDKFIFIYEFLLISNGNLSIGEIPLLIQPQSKINFIQLWDFLISLLYTFSFGLLPHRAISYGLISISGIFVQLFTTNFLMGVYDFNFNKAIIFSVLVGATSNYLINNALTFRNCRLKGWEILKGLFRFILVISLPLSINIGISSTFYKVIVEDTFWSQIMGILVSFIWNYIASSKFVWNTK